MSTILLKTFGSVISDKSIGNSILEKVQNSLKTDGSVTVDFTDVVTMATFCARQIFGDLYVELGRETFIKKVNLLNANDTVKAIISDAILYSVKNAK